MTTHTIAILALKASMNRRLKTAENNFELNEEKNQEMNGHKRPGEIYKIELIKRIEEVEPATGMTLSEEVAAKAAQYNEEVEPATDMTLSAEVAAKAESISYNKIYEEIDIAPECDINDESFKGNIMRN
eukprot:24842_1